MPLMMSTIATLLYSYSREYHFILICWTCPSSAWRENLLSHLSCSAKQPDVQWNCVYLLKGTFCIQISLALLPGAWQHNWGPRSWSHQRLALQRSVPSQLGLTSVPASACTSTQRGNHQSSTISTEMQKSHQEETKNPSTDKKL